jgi:UDP-GlcNAc:undecaprenyl-phosphate GlcNAc-1-phosphate transferase
MIAIRFGAVDRPDGGRKLHDAPTPLFGGLAIVTAFLIVTIGVLLSSSALTAGEITPMHYVGFFIGLAILVTVGVFDDRYSLPPRFALTAFFCASLAAVLGGIDVAKVTNPLGGYVVLAPFAASAVAFGWIFIMTMTTKLLDGIDGLASSVSLIASVMIAALALTPTYFQSDVALLALIFSAAIFGFLLWNWAPAQIFLGESGSTALGFVVGVLSVIAGSKMATALLVFGIPTIDVAMVALRRMRAGKNPFTTADRRHAHFMLRDVGLSARSVTVVYVIAVGLFGTSTLLFSSWQKVVVLGILTVFAGIAIHLLAKRTETSQK